MWALVARGASRSLLVRASRDGTIFSDVFGTGWLHLVTLGWWTMIALSYVLFGAKF